MIIALAGRRVDRDGTLPRRFPLDNVEFVRQRIRNLLKREGVTTVVSSAACGADLLALSEAGTLGIRRRVILPFDRRRFLETSVLDRPGDWSFYDAVIDQVSASGDLITMTMLPNEKGPYTAANDKILMEAAALGQAAGEDVRALVVWDGRSSGPEDITNSFAVSAKNQGLNVMEVLTLRTCY